MSYNLNVELQKREDRGGKTFYVGKIKGPFTIDAKDGVTFLIFVSDDGAEQLQISEWGSGKKRDDKE